MCGSCTSAAGSSTTAWSRSSCWPGSTSCPSRPGRRWTGSGWNGRSGRPAPGWPASPARSWSASSRSTPTWPTAAAWPTSAAGPTSATSTWPSPTAAAASPPGWSARPPTGSAWPGWSACSSTPGPRSTTSWPCSTGSASASSPTPPAAGTTRARSARPGLHPGRRDRPGSWPDPPGRLALLDVLADGAVLGGAEPAVGAGHLLGAAGGVAGRVGRGGVGADGPGLGGRDAAKAAALGGRLADRPRALGRARDLLDHVLAPAAGLGGGRLGLGVAAGGGGARVERRQLAAVGGVLEVGGGQVGGGHAVPGRPVLLVQQVVGVAAALLPLRQGEAVAGRHPAALLGGGGGALGHVRRAPGLVFVQRLGHVLGRGGVRAGQHVGRADQHLVPGRGGRLGVHRVVVEALAQAPVDLELVDHRAGVLLGQLGGHGRLLRRGHGPEQDHVVVTGRDLDPLVPDPGRHPQALADLLQHVKVNGHRVGYLLVESVVGVGRRGPPCRPGHTYPRDAPGNQPGRSRSRRDSSTSRSWSRRRATSAVTAPRSRSRRSSSRWAPSTSWTSSTKARDPSGWPSSPCWSRWASRARYRSRSRSTSSAGTLSASGSTASSRSRATSDSRARARRLSPAGPSSSAPTPSQRITSGRVRPWPTRETTITVKERNTTRLRSGNGPPPSTSVGMARGRARFTTPRMPAQPITVIAGRPGNGSRSRTRADSRGSQLAGYTQATRTTTTTRLTASAARARSSRERPSIPSTTVRSCTPMRWPPSAASQATYGSSSLTVFSTGASDTRRRTRLPTQPTASPTAVPPTAETTSSVPASPNEKVPDTAAATGSGGDTTAPRITATAHGSPSIAWARAATAAVVTSTSPTARSAIGRRLARRSRRSMCSAAQYSSGGRNRARISSGSSSTWGSPGIRATASPASTSSTGSGMVVRPASRTTTATAASSPISSSRVSMGGNGGTGRARPPPGVDRGVSPAVAGGT